MAGHIWTVHIVLFCIIWTVWILRGKGIISYMTTVNVYLIVMLNYIVDVVEFETK